VISSSGAACETLGLDNASIHDYETGKLSRWTTEEQGMNECFKANLGGVPKGGSVTWTGPGIFAARYREICIEISGDVDTDTVESWCCEMGESSSSTNHAVLIDNCVLSDVIVSTVNN